MVGNASKTPKEGSLSLGYRIIIATLAAALIAGIVALGMMVLSSNRIEPTFMLMVSGVTLLAALPVFAAWAHHQRKLEQANGHLQQLAFEDSMLGCMNRRGFTDNVTNTLASSAPNDPSALLIIDVDNFKAINDRFGHDLGDEALKAIALAIRSTVRATDFLGRIGGEEFGLFMPATDLAEARMIAQRICNSVATTLFAPMDQPCQLTVSVGGVMAVGTANFATLFRTADKRLYAAKNSGRNRVLFSDDHPLISPDANATA